MERIQYISDENGSLTGVIVPIEMWREIQAKLETGYLLKSDAMKKRLPEAKVRTDRFSFEDVRRKLGI